MVDNPYSDKETLFLREEIPLSIYLAKISKSLITTSAQFHYNQPTDEDERDNNNNNNNNNNNKEGNISDSSTTKDTGVDPMKFIVKKSIKSHEVLMNGIEKDSTKGITLVDALVCLFPPLKCKYKKINNNNIIINNNHQSDHDHDEEEVFDIGAEKEEEEEDIIFDENTSFEQQQQQKQEKKDIRRVSVARSDHVDRMDVINLQERILQLCDAKKVKYTGICQIRESIYTDALNELVRQVVVMCPERGLLLWELCEELRETNRTFDLLFDTSCQFAVRKAIERDIKRTMLQELEELNIVVRTMENRVQELRAKRQGLEKRFSEQRATGEKLHEEEVAFLKKGNSQLTAEIKKLMMRENAGS